MTSGSSDKLSKYKRLRLCCCSVFFSSFTRDFPSMKNLSLIFDKLSGFKFDKNNALFDIFTLQKKNISPSNGYQRLECRNKISIQTLS